MSKVLAFLCFLILSFTFAQEKETPRSSYIQAEYFYGNILKHQPSVSPLILGHPEGVFISWNQRNYGREAWEQRYNYPDFGISFGYQDYKNEALGELYSLYGHYNFYLFNRKSPNSLILRAGIGFAYNTNPYDKVSNTKNISFGTKMNSSTYFKLLYQRQRIFGPIGVQAGLTFIHASNSSIKAPNTGINTWGVTVGLNYDLEEEPIAFHEHSEEKYFKEPIRINVALRGGVSESDNIDTGQYPFFVFSAYADKRLNRKSAIQLGTDVFVAYFLKEHIKFDQIKNGNFEEDYPDFKRASVFVGHELFINKLSVIAQIGYYVYSPYVYESNLYQRLGLKRYIGDNWYGAVSMKTHAANAESVEFGIGYRFN